MLNHFNEKHVDVCCMMLFDVFLIVDLLLIYINSLKIVVVVEVLTMNWTDLNNCRFYLFFISALSFFFKNSCFSQRWKCWIEVKCRLFSDDSWNISLFVDGAWSNSRTTFLVFVEFYRCLEWELIILMIDGCLIELYDVDLLILANSNSEKLLICFVCLRCLFLAMVDFFLLDFKNFLSSNL